jgi:hypothetical protein
MNNKSLIIENISDYKYKFSTRNLVITKYNDNNDNNDNNNDKYKKEKSYYFILDGNNSKDFGFWIFESFIFINLLIELNKDNKDIKILIKRFHNNDNIMKILNYFNINNEIVNKIDNYNNICYSPIIYSLYYHHHNLNNDNYYNYHLNYYINYINSNLDNNFNKNENVFINNNSNNLDDTNIKNYIKNNNGIIIDDFDIKNNFSILNNATNIFLFYNSSFYFNCIFLKNKNIYFIEKNIYRPNGFNSHIYGNPFLKYLHDIIFKNNKICLVTIK